MDRKERISELNLLIEELKERKMEDVKRQDFESAALHRGQEKDYLKEKDLLIEELDAEKLFEMEQQLDIPMKDRFHKTRLND